MTQDAALPGRQHSAPVAPRFPSTLLSGFPSSLFGPGLSQHARLITLASAQEAGLPESLVVERFHGQESVNGNFQFDIDALSVSTDLDLKQFISTELTLRLLQADGSRRAWHGYCTQASWLGADGGLARYRLRLESFLAFLDRRRDSFLFQDMSVTDIASAVLKEYPQANFALDVTQTLTKRDICTQYRESDFAFLRRILASEGLNFRFEHQQEGEQGQASGQQQARHKLVIFDREAKAPDLPGGDTGDGIKFRGRGMKQLTGRYNYSEYWVFRGWLDRKSYVADWTNSGGKGPVISNPQIVSDVPYNAVDTAGFYCAKTNILKAADGGATAEASSAVTRLVNPHERPLAPRRLTETLISYRVLSDEK